MLLKTKFGINIKKKQRRILMVLFLAAAAVCAWEKYTFEGYGFYFYKGLDNSKNPYGKDGIWRVDLKTGQKVQIFGDNSGRFQFSGCGLASNGKQLIFHGPVVGSGIVNNDGTGYKKIPFPLYSEEGRMFLSRLGFYKIENNKLRRYDIKTGTYKEFNFPKVDGRPDYPLHVSGDGTRIWTRAYKDGWTFGPKGWYKPYARIFWTMHENGAPYYMHGRNFWGHGESITLDGSVMLFQSFSHNAINIIRFKDAMFLNRVIYEPMPFDYEKDCNGGASSYTRGMDGRTFRHCANDNEWIYHNGAPARESITSFAAKCYMNTVLNWRKNRIIQIHGIEPVTQKGNGERIELAGIWKGYDLPSVNDNSAYLVAYKTEETFHMAKKSSPLEKKVYAGNIGDGDLGTVSLKVEPASAESWLQPQISSSGNKREVIMRVIPSALSADKQNASVVLSSPTARNTTTIKVYTDRTMLPQPTNVYCSNQNTTDKFAYAKITWEDNADGESGYIIEQNGSNPDDKNWDEVKHEYTWAGWKETVRLGPNTTSHVFKPAEYAFYRIRAFGAADTRVAISVRIAERARFPRAVLRLVPARVVRLVIVVAAADEQCRCKRHQTEPA